MLEGVIITNLLNADQKRQVAKLYFEASSNKFHYLRLLTKNQALATQLLTQCIAYENGLYALHNHQVLGFIGLEKGEGYFAPLNYKAFLNTFGYWGGLWRYAFYLLYRLFHGQTSTEVLHIVPLVIALGSQGLGIDTKLLEASFMLAQKLNKQKLCLEVVDPNKQKLYEQLGFTTVKTRHLGLLSPLAGFHQLFQMEKQLS